MKDYYKILNVDKNADIITIKKKYKKKALKYHPDKNMNNENATKKFNLISEAYSVLSDPYKRGRYDSEYESIVNNRSGLFNSFFSYNDSLDIFNNFFNDDGFDLNSFRKSLPKEGVKTYSYSSSTINKDGTIETKIKTNSNGKKNVYYKKEIIDRKGNKKVLEEKGNKNLFYDKYGKLFKLTDKDNK